MPRSRLGAVDDQPRRPVLGEDERNVGLEVGHEHDALGLRLRDVAEPRCQAFDGRERRDGGDRRRSGAAGGLERARRGRVEQDVCPGLDRPHDPALRLVGIECEEHAQRFGRMAAVVARVGEQPARGGTVAGRGGLEVVDSCERAPRPRIASEQLTSKLDRVQRRERVHEPLRAVRCTGVERDSEEIQPHLAVRVPDGVERAASSLASSSRGLRDAAASATSRAYAVPEATLDLDGRAVIVRLTSDITYQSRTVTVKILALEILRDQPEEDAVDPLVVSPVRLSANALAREACSLGVAQRALVEAVDLELEAMEPQVGDQMALEESRRLVRDLAAAEVGVHGKTAEVGDPASLVHALELHRPRALVRPPR